MKKVGFIGLGIMGGAMARNLLKAGYKLTVNDIDPAPVRELEQLGAHGVKTPREVAENSDVVITMVVDGDQVRTIALGEEGLVKGSRRGLILVDMTSVNPFQSQEISRAIEPFGIEMLDAPVSGGDVKAADGTLAIMVGGKESVLEEVRPILEAMGSSITLCGDIGAGNITKCANQIIVAGNIMIAAEALVFAKKCGVNPQSVYEAIRGGLAGSAVMDLKVPKMLSGDFKPGGRVWMHIKDGNNVLDAGHRVGAPLPISVLVLEQIQWLLANGYQMEDHANMVRYYEHLAGTTIRNEEQEDRLGGG